jgi:biotin carboxyl carrier protein
MATVISTIDNKEFKWSFDSDSSSVSLGQNKYRVDIQKISPERYSILLDGKSYQAIVTRNEFSYSILINGRIYNVEVETSAKKLINLRVDAGGKNRALLEIRSPMPGMVVRCEVQEGTKIEAGRGLLILEAMKMENEIRATRSGIIKKIFVQERQVVDKGELLITME